MAGGFNGIMNLGSTEILTDGKSAWELVGDLPRARNGLRATNVNDIVYVLGKDTGGTTLY